MRLLISLLAVTVLFACGPTPPSDGAVTVSMPISDEVVASDTDETVVAEDGDEAGEDKQIILTNDNPNISDTQNFAALTERVSIEDDKEILKAQRQEFQVIAPTALPSRSGNTVNVAEFALQTTHNVGEKKYSRMNPLGAALAKQNCRKYRLPDDAQEAFLKTGGPKRDSKNLDPDGDGFACDWTPVTYRELLQ